VRDASVNLARRLEALLLHGGKAAGDTRVVVQPTTSGSLLAALNLSL